MRLFLFAGACPQGQRTFRLEWLPFCVLALHGSFGTLLPDGIQAKELPYDEDRHD